MRLQQLSVRQYRFNLVGNMRVRRFSKDTLCLRTTFIHLNGNAITFDNDIRGASRSLRGARLNGDRLRQTARPKARNRRLTSPRRSRRAERHDDQTIGRMIRRYHELRKETYGISIAVHAFADGISVSIEHEDNPVRMATEILKQYVPVICAEMFDRPMPDIDLCFRWITDDRVAVAASYRHRNTQEHQGTGKHQAHAHGLPALSVPQRLTFRPSASAMAALANIALSAAFALVP